MLTRMLYGKICLPVDGSEPANAGLREVVKIAADRSREVLLIHVLELPHRNERYPSESVGSIIQDSYRQPGMKILEAARQTLASHGIVAETLLAEAHGVRASTLIVAHATEWKADLIVMGTHSRHGLSRAILGSDAADVVRMALAPVLLVRGGS